jgi:hypothetical protein
MNWGRIAAEAADVKNFMSDFDLDEEDNASACFFGSC